MSSNRSGRTFWRISGYADLSGKGAKIVSGRWHSTGHPVVYLAESPAGALLERLVHLQDGNGTLPRYYDLLEVMAAQDLELKELMPLGDTGWKEAIDSTRQIGDAWLISRSTLLARVPSAIVPRTWNVLMNPEHPDAEKLRIGAVIHERFDSRLFRWEAR